MTPQGAKPSAAPERYVAFTRQFTGYPVNRGYVRDRQTGQIVAACPHTLRPNSKRGGHRRGVHAQRCAERLLRALLRGSDE